MTLSVSGTPGAAAATTITLPTHAVGDMIVLFAYRDGSTAIPTVPTAGGTVPTWNTIDGPTGANLNSMVACYAIATATNHTSGTWTNATGLAVIVIHSSAGAPALGGHAQGGGSGANTCTAPAITLVNASGSSVILHCGGARNVTAWGALGAGYTNRVNVATEIRLATKDTTTTDGSVSLVPTNVNSGSGYRGQSVEIVENINVSITAAVATETISAPLQAVATIWVYADVAASTVSMVAPTVDISGGTTPKSDSDSGSDSETQTEIAVYSQSDSGSDSEAATETAVYSNSDSGSDSESAIEIVALSSSDSGTSNEVISTRSATLTDSGTDSESGSAGIFFSSSDSGSDSEATTEIAAVPGTDSGSGVDAISGRVSFTAEIGSDTETISETAVYAFSDAGTASTESGSSSAGAIQVSSSDNGSSSEAITSRKIADGDFGLVYTGLGFGLEPFGMEPFGGVDAGEVETLVAVYAQAEAGTDTETITDRKIVLPEIAAGTDAAELTTKFGTDTGTDTEAITLSAALTSSESASGVDTYSVTYLLSSADSGTAIEAASIPKVAHSTTDTGTDSEIEIEKVVLASAQTGSASDIAIAGSLILAVPMQITVSSALSKVSITVASIAFAVPISFPVPVPVVILSRVDAGTGADVIASRVIAVDETASATENQTLNVGGTVTISPPPMMISVSSALSKVSIQAFPGACVIALSFPIPVAGSNISGIVAPPMTLTLSMGSFDGVDIGITPPAEESTLTMPVPSLGGIHLVSSADSGIGTDGLTIISLIDIEDTAIATESQGTETPVPSSDSGSGSEIEIQTYAVASDERPEVLDEIAARVVSVGETDLITELATLINAIVVASDSVTGSEIITRRAVVFSDAGSDSENATSKAVISSQDAGSATDSGSVGFAHVFVSSSDSGAITETQPLVAAIAQTDTISSSESEAGQIPQTRGDIDTGTISDLAVAAVLISATDSNSRLESVTLSVRLSVSDTGSSSEVGGSSIGQQSISSSDSSVATENLTLIVTFTAVETITGTTYEILGAKLVQTDSFTLSDFITEGVVLSAADTGLGKDTYQSVISVPTGREQLLGRIGRQAPEITATVNTRPRVTSTKKQAPILERVK